MNPPSPNVHAPPPANQPAVLSNPQRPPANGTLKSPSATPQPTLARMLKGLRHICHHPFANLPQAPHLEGVLQHIALCQGAKVALHLVDTCGGQVLSVPAPKRLKTTHALYRALGEPIAQRLCKEFQGEVIYIPTLAKLRKQIRDRQIVRAAKLGGSAADLAQASMLTVRQIYSILRGHEAPALCQKKRCSIKQGG